MIIFFIVVVAVAGAVIGYTRTNQNTQQASSQKKPVTIGVLSLKTNKSYESSIAAMKERLTQKGYADINYIQEEVTESSQFEAIAKKYADMDVDLIVTNSTPAVKAAMQATRTIPIVFGSVGDPVLNGVVPNMESSGRNVTGVSSLAVELTRKRMDQLKLLIPNLSKLYIFHQPGEVSSDNGYKLAGEEAAILKIAMIEKPASLSAEVQALALGLKGSEGQAILMSSSALVWGSVNSLIEAQNRERIPVIGTDMTMAVKGAVITYGPRYEELGRQVGDIVTQVLSGTKPQYIPIQRPERIELVINKKAADAIGLLIPESLLQNADEVLR